MRHYLEEYLRSNIFSGSWSHESSVTSSSVKVQESSKFATLVQVLSTVLLHCNHEVIHQNIICRYVIVKVVRKDHLDQLPVPSRMKKYLNTPFYYSEQVETLQIQTLVDQTKLFSPDYRLLSRKNKTRLKLQTNWRNIKCFQKLVMTRLEIDLHKIL